jgi:peptidoglycan/xylan/chitin deacetylase (PgdA/CDA1 family)
MAALGACGRLVTPRRRLLILIYHRVLRQRDELYPGIPTAADFTWQMELVARHAAPLPLHEAVTRLHQGSLPARALAVTFDDGYADNVSVAAPILRSTGVHATFFVATGFLDGGRMWNDTVIESVRGCTSRAIDLDAIGLGTATLDGPGSRRTLADRVIAAIKHRTPSERLGAAQLVATASGVSLPDDLMMRSTDVRDLAASGLEIGAHTVSHPILRALDRDSAASEISTSRQRLESITGHAVRFFAYPNGRPGDDYTEEHVRIVRDLGFEAALSTQRGVAHRGSDPFQLPRFTPWDRNPTRFLARLLLEFRRPA